jgi:hypothetical protein
LVTAGCNIAVGAGVLVGVGVVAVIGYDCGEPVDVTVWDRRTAHPVCDAKVTAEKEGTVHEFSPCYRVYLGEGTWTVKASKAGYTLALGTVTVGKERRCSEPTFHSVELTLVPVGEATPH